MLCSVVILNWNGEAMLRRYLPSVVAFTPSEEAEIVVADNGSTDGSVALLQKEFPSVRLILLDKNYGFAEGYNRALQQVESRYTVLLNSDVAVTEGWLTPLLTYMEQYPEVAAMQPKILSDLQKDHFEHAGAAGGYLDILGYPFCRGRIVGYAAKDEGQYDTEADVLWTSGACMCVRTNLYKEVGGLDGDFFAHMEEIDLCWRLCCRGHRLVCLPKAKVYHLGGGALHYESPRKTYLNFRNNLLMLYKNLPASRLWWVMAVRWGLDYVAALQLLLTGKPKNAWAALQARWDYHRMKPSMRQKRQENMRMATVPYPDTICRRSIIWDYYIRQKRQ